MPNIKIFCGEDKLHSLLMLILKVKGVERPERITELPCELAKFANECVLTHRNVTIVGFQHIARYIDEKYPFPPLNLDSPEKRAFLAMTAQRVLEKGYASSVHERQQLLDEFKLNLPDKGFLCGDTISFLDLAVLPITPREDPVWDNYASRVLAACPQ